jgi:hypothetical protein
MTAERGGERNSHLQMKVTELSRSLRIVFFNVGNCRFLITKAVRAHVFPSSGFIGQVAYCGSGYTVPSCDFGQAQSRQAVSDDRNPVDVQRRTSQPLTIHPRPSHPDLHSLDDQRPSSSAIEPIIVMNSRPSAPEVLFLQDF